MNEKIQILSICLACSGRARFTTGDETSITGEKYKRLVPCSACGGTGKQTQGITIADFTRLQHAIMAESCHLEAVQIPNNKKWYCHLSGVRGFWQFIEDVGSGWLSFRSADGKQTTYAPLVDVIQIHPIYEETL